MRGRENNPLTNLTEYGMMTKAREVQRGLPTRPREATVRKASLIIDGEPVWYAEVSDDHWVQLNFQPEAGDEAEVMEVAEGWLDEDDQRWRPMTYAMRYLRDYGLREVTVSEIGEA